jgi:hypothetical protein
MLKASSENIYECKIRCNSREQLMGLIKELSDRNIKLTGIKIYEKYEEEDEENNKNNN